MFPVSVDGMEHVPAHHCPQLFDFNDLLAVRVRTAAVQLLELAAHLFEALACAPVCSDQHPRLGLHRAELLTHPLPAPWGQLQAREHNLRCDANRPELPSIICAWSSGRFVSHLGSLFGGDGRDVGGIRLQVTPTSDCKISSPHLRIKNCVFVGFGPKSV